MLMIRIMLHDQFLFLFVLIGIVCVSSFHRLSHSSSHVNRSIRPLTSRFSKGGSSGGPPINNINSSRSFADDDDPENEDKVTSSSNPEGNNVVKALIKRWKAMSGDIRDNVKYTTMSVAIALLIRLLLFEPRFIPSLSMFPTFDVGDQLLVDKVSHVVRPYQKRDVVVFNPPQMYIDLTGNTEALIKRIVAVAGDTLEVKNQHLYVNGQLQVENYVQAHNQPDYILPPTTVPEGMLLVLGDNRIHSFDSHIWGFLPKENVIGRAVLKFWPPWRAGFVEGSN